MQHPFIGDLSEKTLDELQETINKKLECYPNPASSGFYIDLKDLEISNVDIFNVYGQKVYNSKPYSQKLKIENSFL